MGLDRLEQLILDRIDANKDNIIEFAHDIYANAELGFKETRTSQKAREFLSSAFANIEENLGITGFRAKLKPDEDFRIALIGELDAVICPSHPKADPMTGAAHVCGHHAQLAAVLGAAIALSDLEISSALDGGVDFIGMPAEEYLEIDYRQELIKSGKLLAGGGKGEFILRGYLDDCDIAFCHHMHTKPDHKEDLLLGSTAANGFVTKKIAIKGKAAHSGANPQGGINALNAAALGLSALAFARETFYDRDFVRIHPVITKSSNAVNVVPDYVELESFVRAKDMEAIEDASMKTDRAFNGAAMAIGAEIDIETEPGYLPVDYKPACDAMKQAAIAISDDIGHANPLQQDSYSSDIGDLMHVMPTIYFSSGGFTGYAHAENFAESDAYTAYVLPAKVMALTIYNLLKNGAEQGKQLAKDERFAPKMTVEEYKKTHSL